MPVDLSSPRATQGAAAGLVLLGFVVDVRAVVPIAAVGLMAAFAGGVRGERPTWAVEVVLLAASTVLFAAGRAGWGWVLALLVAGVAAAAAVADLWIRPAERT